MSKETKSTEVPEFDQADKLRKALRVAGVHVNDMAEYLGVSRNTVSRLINGGVPAKRSTLRLWALRTGVSLAWLESEHPTLELAA